MQIEDVLIHQTHFAGIVVNGGRATLCNVVVAETQSLDVGGGELIGGQGLDLQAQNGVESRVDSTRTIFRGNRGIGVIVFDPSATLNLDDTVICDTLAQVESGIDGRGLAIQDGPSVDVSRSVFERNRDVAVFVGGPETTLKMRHVVVRDTQSQQRTLENGSGLGIQDGAHVELEKGLFERNRESGIGVFSPGTKLDITDVVIRDTLPQESNDTFGIGLFAKEGAQVRAERAFVAGNHFAGMSAENAGTTVDLTDIVIQETLPQESDGQLGWGLSVSNGAQANVSRGVFRRNYYIGVFVTDAESHLALSEVIISETQGQESDGGGGIGLSVETEAHADVDVALVENNRTMGIHVAIEGTTAELDHVVVRGTQPRERDGKFGRGLNIQAGAEVAVSLGVIDGNHNTGVSVTGEGTLLTANDVIIRDTQHDSSEPEYSNGMGLYVDGGARAVVTRAIFERNRDCGVLVFDPGFSLPTLTLADVMIRDTLSREFDGRFGDGIVANSGAYVEISRAFIERSREAGIFVHDRGVVQMWDVVIRETMQTERASQGSGFGAGWGVVSLCGSQVEIWEIGGVQLARGNLHGVPCTEGGTVDLHHGTIGYNPIGVNIQTQDFDIDRLTDNVIFFDNNLDLDMSALPSPDAHSSVGM